MNLSPLTPLTKLYVLKDIPLDNTYTDTLTFGSLSEQVSWFQSKAKYHWENMTTIRLNNVIRIPVVADNVYDCNYVLWQNANFGNKWFFGFITNIEWININSCHLTVELDVMQTWYFDYKLNPCWIERQHVNSDAIGENLIPENLELGEYIVSDSRQSNFIEPPQNDEQGNLVNWWIAIASSSNDLGNYAPGKILGNMYTGLHIYYFSSLSSANEFIEKITKAGYPDAIITAYMMPEVLAPSEAQQVQGITKFNYSVGKETSNIDGYVPKNNKLFTYPYCFLNVSNLAGNMAQYKYEYFTDNSSMATFELAGGPLPDSELTCAPKNYKGQTINYDEMITINGFPTVAIATDYYRAWLAQNKSSQAVQLLGTALTIFGSGAGAIMSGGALAPAFASSILGGVGTVKELMLEHKRASISPPQLHGNQTGATMFGLGQYNFLFEDVCITAQFAKRIDDFFNMYGYAIHDVEIPNITGRQNWNYVKTVGCDATGSIPFNDIDKIKSNFDNGITFWHTKDVGNYNLPNGIV